VGTAAELQQAIDAKQPGDTVSVTYVREGESHTVQVQLARRPA
jgi:S1-C subfamily serine protease